jgi:hypothetical protein
VQTGAVALVNATVNPELAVALTVTGLAFSCDVAGPVNEIVWLPMVTVKDCATCGAAAKVPLPAWFALIVQVPIATSVTLVPATVQTPVVALVNATVSPDVAVALTATGLAFIAVEAGPVKEIV